MKTLITPADVVALAFSDGEYLPPDSVAEADIAAAEHRYMEPILGRRLLDALYNGEYGELLDEYVAPALAMSVRAVIQRSLNVRTGAHGLSVPGQGAAYTVARTAADELQASLRERAHSLRRRLSDYLALAAAGGIEGVAIPEYEPAADIMQKCSIDGGIVQIY